jgi:hypothetical protein
MLGAKNMFAATDLQRQVFFLLFFLCLFGMGGDWMAASFHSFLFRKKSNFV